MTTRLNTLPLFVTILWLAFGMTCPASVHINEFLTENLPRANDPYAPIDMDGECPDWIEIKNNTGSTFNLAGYSLSDDPAQPRKWTFATNTIPANGYLVVFASGKNRAINNVQPHTNFKLASSGQLLLTSPSGSNVQTIVYSSQRQTVSWGSVDNTSMGTMTYLTRPTPGAANLASSAVTNFVSDTHFDVDRGIYSTPFTVRITCNTTGATIAYTLNGSAPTPTNGFQVPAASPTTAPTATVTVARTTLLRARAYKTGMGPSDIDTQSYLFLGDVLSQNGPTPSMGLSPSDTLTWGTAGANLANISAFPGLTFFGVNPGITNEANPTNRFVVDDLLHVPIISLVADWRHLFGPNSSGQTDGGIYPPASGVAIEGVDRAASLEFINPDGDPLDPNGKKGFQVDGNIHIFGGTSQDRWKSYKLSFRFQCATDVREPVYGPDAASRFDNFVLDARMNNTWMHPTDNNQRIRCDYVNDQVMGDLQNAMSGRGGAHNRPVHLFLNGLYWGLYSLHEKPDHHFAASYYGGEADEYDVFKHSLAPNFSESDPLVNTLPANPTNAISRNNATVVTNYEAMLDLIGVGYIAPNPTPDLTILTNYEAVAAVLDIDDFIDYMILNFVAGNWDWSDKNLYATFKRTGGGKWRFHSWDAEHTFRTGTENFLTGLGNESNPPRTGQPKTIHNRLKANPEYRLKFADHIRKHMFNNGAMSVTGMSNAFQRRFDEIEEAIRAESARWGHIRASVRPSPNANVPYKKTDWLARVRSLLATESGTNPSLLQNRWNLLMAPAPANGSFRTEGLYPSLNAPDFSHYGGSVPNGLQLTLSHSNAAGVIYYTTDGTDPRQYGTSAIAPSARAYSEPLVLNAPTRVRARTYNGGVWSAMTEAMFHMAQDLTTLVVTEIMYNPPDFGGIRGSDLEFIELMNAGPAPLNLSGLMFTNGISYAFADGTTLAPGQRFLLVRNANTFTNRYPGVIPDGVYGGQLDNAGETITLVHMVLGTTVLSFTYNDRAPWPVAADGHGFSLVLKDPGARPDLDEGTNWRASALPGGSPGAVDPPSNIPPIVINEVLSASVFPEQDAIELFNPAENEVDIGGWFITDDPGNPRKFRVPDGTRMPAGTFLVFTETDFNPTPGTNNSFSISSWGEPVYLFSGDASTNLTGYSHGHSFSPSAPGATFGRYLTSTGAEHFPTQLEPTLGTNNAGPRVGPVVINEIHYNPPAESDEFIELRNLLPTPVALHDPQYPTNTWKLAGLGFQFPTNLTLAAHQLLLLVSTNPADFKAKYGVPDDVLIVGPYPGLLQNSGENLVLQRPGTPDSNGVPYITVDEVRYNDKAPWPPAADGSGSSLQRKAGAAYGNDPINWTAAVPTPGLPYAGGTPPTILSHPASQFVVAYQDASFSVVAEGPEPLYYQWRFSGDDIPGATNRTLLLTNVQFNQAGDYRVVVFNAAGSAVSSNALLTVGAPPVISQQPFDTNVMRGSNAVLSVAASGTGPLRYQWLLNGLPLPQATNATYAILNAQISDEGTYTVEITDNVGTIRSQPALVRVIWMPEIVEQPTPLTNVVLQGGNATFRVVTTGSLPVSYRWRRGSTTLTNMILNSNICVYTLTNVQPMTASNITVVVTNLASRGVQRLSSNAYLYILLDLDRDGMADVWEGSYGFSTNNPNDALEDADGDRSINRDEYIAGTHPLDPVSRFEASRVEALSPSLCVIEFLAVSNRTYLLDVSPGLAPTAWTNTSVLEAAETNRWVRWTNTPLSGQTYYRLRIP